MKHSNEKSKARDKRKTAVPPGVASVRAARQQLVKQAGGTAKGLVELVFEESNAKKLRRRSA